MYSARHVLFHARSRLLFKTQKDFLISLCKPNPSIRPKDWRIAVVTAPRGFRKTTTAKEVEIASKGTIKHCTQADIKEKKAEGKSIFDILDMSLMSLGLPPILGRLWVMLLPTLAKLGWKSKYKCIILDDVMADFEGKDANDAAKQLRYFLKKIRSRLPYQYLMIITSNEGFRECISDSTTADELVTIYRFPPPAVSELAVALKDALKNRQQDSTTQAFGRVPDQITSDLITEELVANVVEQLPIRHGCSMRVWGLLLSHIDANTPPEALSAAVIETLKDENFLLSVAKKVDLEVAQLSLIKGLMESDKMLEVEIKKLANLLSLTLTPTAPLKVPGRLVLISLLKMAKVDDAKDLHDALEEKQVRPKIGRIIAQFEGRND